MRLPKYQWAFTVGLLLIALAVVVFMVPALIGLVLILGGVMGH